jgi:GIY-YIG catalytic domain
MLVIYAFECIKNGSAYVGYSADHRRRLQEHRRLLRRGVHRASRMVADWRTYGSTAFHLRVLEVLPDAVEPHQAREAETRWQRHFLERGRLGNELKCQMCGQPLPFEVARGRYLDRVPICGEQPSVDRQGDDRRDGDIRERRRGNGARRRSASREEASHAEGSAGRSRP